MNRKKGDAKNPQIVLVDDLPEKKRKLMEGVNIKRGGANYKTRPFYYCKTKYKITNNNNIVFDDIKTE